MLIQKENKRWRVYQHANKFVHKRMGGKYSLAMDYTTLIVPGLNDSGPNHWQTWLEDRISGSLRVTQEEWHRPKIIPWARNVHDAILESENPVILIAHSFGVLASIVGAARIADHVAGALYVAPADPSKFTAAGEILPDNAQGWGSGLYNLIPKEPLGYPTILTASLNDPYMPFKRAGWWATKWQSRLVSLGFAGHVNITSGFGAWPGGEQLYQDLVHAADSEHTLLDQVLSWS